MRAVAWRGDAETGREKREKLAFVAESEARFIGSDGPRHKAATEGGGEGKAKGDSTCCGRR